MFASFFGSPSLSMHLTMSSLPVILGVPVLLVIQALSESFRPYNGMSAEPFKRAVALLEQE